MINIINLISSGYAKVRAFFLFAISNPYVQTTILTIGLGGKNIHCNINGVFTFVMFFTAVAPFCLRMPGLFIASLVHYLWWHYAVFWHGETHFILFGWITSVIFAAFVAQQVITKED